MTGALIPVTGAPVFDPGAARRTATITEETTLAEAVRLVFPFLPEDHWDEVRVALVTSKGVMPIDRRLWHRVRPNAGVHVVIRLRPGDPGTLTALLSVFAQAASTLAQTWAAAIVPTAGALQGVVAGLITAGLTLAVSLLISSLIGRPSPDEAEERRRPTYQISGWRNELRPGRPVPLVFGRHRYAPPFAAPSYTEIVGNDQYIRALFTCGYGRLDISDIRIGDTPITDFDEVEVEIREGRSSDDPVTLYPHQVIERPENVELVRPYPRDDAGNAQTEEATIATPVIRWSASDAQRASIIFSFPQGLYSVSDDGDVESSNVSVRIRQRAEGASTWTTVKTLNFRNRKREQHYRQYTWTLPSRGRWEIEITRMTDEELSTRVSNRVFFAALQSHRPEYPLNIDKPLALIALRIKATYQLSGTLETVNCVAQRYGPVWDGDSWSTGLTRNPASAYRTALQSDANPFSEANSALDLDEIADWYEFCDDKGLKYDRVHDYDETLGEMLPRICSAGRASRRHDGLKWGVIIDRPQSLVVDHISPRNSSGVTWRRPYFDPPHAFRVAFADETNDYEPAERLVRWPGYDGDITVTEALDLPGKTDPDEVWTEARRRQLEILLRPDDFTASQDGRALVATRGDLLMASIDLLSDVQKAGRVLKVTGTLVEIDEEVEMEAGTDYAIRFRVFADAEDTIGTSEVRQVETVAGTTTLLNVLVDGTLPAVGDLIQFGLLSSDSLAVTVTGTESGDGGNTILRMKAAAPEIDDLIDAEVPPVWSSRVGSEADVPDLLPGVPKLTGVLHGLSGTGDPDGLEILFAATKGDAPTTDIRVEHRLEGAGAYTTFDVPAADGGAALDGYNAGDSVQIRLVGLSAIALESDPSTAVTVEIGADDPDTPGALNERSIIVTGGLGRASITFATGSDEALDRVQIYRVPTGETLDKEEHAVGSPVTVTTGTTLTYVDGDGTRSNLLGNGAFDDASVWSADANWTLAAGEASHTPGAADTILQPLSLAESTVYRGQVTVSGLTAGDLTPTLFGGTDQSGDPISADGTIGIELGAVSGNTDFGFAASSDCDASIDDVILFQVTPSCVPAGEYTYYLEPQNSLGAAGPTTSGDTATVI
ncbi:phage tail protein [Pseudoruegeria sp. HB172150]|uniref:TipJ family phage tail tip protein n=1 Tax=Pseudoruegeria sp. HB172150 TaxID=2721164 RepID=UPI0015577E4A|nr:phage tail protein [Pseudoruegeria sp. HB172150]